MRSILIRLAIPTLLAVVFLAYFGVPVADRLLEDWFRADIDMRAQLLAKSISASIGPLIDKDQPKELGKFLAGITADERLVAVVLCRADGSLLLKTDRTPKSISCPDEQAAGKHTDRLVQLPSGSVEVSAFPVATAGGNAIDILIIHDLQFIDRRQSTARNYVLASAVLFATLLALVVGFIFWLLLRRWVRVLVGDIRGLRFLDDAHSESESSPILSQVRAALRDLEANQRLEIDFHENWTPHALQQVVREHLHEPEVFVVSNREPYIHNETDQGVVVQVPASGMVTALESIVRACSGTWIAHGSGTADRRTVDRHDHIKVPPEDPSYTLRRVWLNEAEESGFYYGFSNEGLWPLCHLVYIRPAFRESDWRQYQAVNERFARVVASESKTSNPVVLVQDFHFALLPGLLREFKHKATILLFWHIPWPNAETFGVCPWKQEILTHMLAADILGFHTRHHCQNFLATVDRFVECQIDHEQLTVTLRGHVCRIVSYPISIEWPPRWLALVPSPEISSANVRARFGIGPDVSLGLGVERWDFTKGIVERLHALEMLLEKDPECIGKVTLLQVAAPSRSTLPAYQALQAETRAEVERINARFATDGWKPIILMAQHHQPRDVFELYRAANFCIVNSLHDGMNLVAKEFIAARDDDDGVLILSSFAGASRELPEALLINPFDVGETAAAIKLAMRMPREERRQCMKLMRRTVKENNVYRWAGRMLMDAAQIRQRQALAKRGLKL